MITNDEFLFITITKEIKNYLKKPKGKIKALQNIAISLLFFVTNILIVKGINFLSVIYGDWIGLIGLPFALCLIILPAIFVFILVLGIMELIFYPFLLIYKKINN